MVIHIKDSMTVDLLILNQESGRIIAFVSGTCASLLWKCYNENLNSPQNNLLGVKRQINTYNVLPFILLICFQLILEWYSKQTNNYLFISFLLFLFIFKWNSK